MKTKSFLLGATALTFLSGAAFADSNVSAIHQAGSGNSAVVDQFGISNLAGYVQTQYANLNYILRQIGDENSIEVTQSGNVNKLSHHSPVNGQHGTLQQGDHNKLTIQQKSGSTTQAETVNGNWIKTIRQVSSDTASLTGANTLSIIQNDGNTGLNYVKHQIERVTQRNNGTGSTNTVSITQTGGLTSNQGAGHYVQSVTQNGATNAVTLSQTGLSGTNVNGNKVDEVRQVGNANIISIVQSGLNNGRGALSGNAAVAGVGTSDVIQTGNTNLASLSISGNSNNFGVLQNGDSNSIGQLTIVGNLNQIGVAQDGISNVVAVGTIYGNSNNVGINQDGTNSATLDLLQTSSTNLININQVGLGLTEGANDATVTITGDSNELNLQQAGDNSATISIVGSNNNAAAGFTPAGLNPGDVLQTGLGNSVSLKVGSLTPGSNGNQFAFTQTGNTNKITGTIDGAGNQAQAVQIGNLNQATFSQFGGDNFVSVSQ